MRMIEGNIDMTGHHVWWVIGDGVMVPFQGPDAPYRAMDYMNTVTVL